MSVTVGLTFRRIGRERKHLPGSLRQQQRILNWLTVGTWTVPVPQYYLSTSVSSAGTGTITPASGWFNLGTQVTLTAEPQAGYRFTGYSGSTSSGTSPLTIVMNGPITETANFTGVSSVDRDLHPLRQFYAGPNRCGVYSYRFQQRIGSDQRYNRQPDGLASFGSNPYVGFGCGLELRPARWPMYPRRRTESGSELSGPHRDSGRLAKFSSLRNQSGSGFGGGAPNATASDPTSVDALPRYANPLAFSTSASVIGGVNTTFTVTYTDDNGPTDIASGQIKIDNCYFAWDTSGNIRLYGSQNSQPDAVGVLGQSSTLWAGNCSINLTSSSLSMPAANPKSRVLSLNISFPNQSFFSTADNNVSSDFVGQHEVYAWGYTVRGLATGQTDLGALVVSQGQDFTLSISPSGPVAVGTNTTLNLVLTAKGVNGFTGSIPLTTQLQQLGSGCLTLAGAPASISANTQANISIQNSNCSQAPTRCSTSKVQFRH